MGVAWVLSGGRREVLERVAGSGLEPHCRVVRAGALLALAGGGSVRLVARDMGFHQDTVRGWRDRFLESGPGGVGAGPPGRGRKPGVAAAVEAIVADTLGLDVVDREGGQVAAAVEAIVADTLGSAPDDGSVCWSTGAMVLKSMSVR